MRHLSSPLDQLNLEAICAYRGTFATSPSAATVGGFFIILPSMLLISFTVSFSMWSINSLIGFLQQHRTFSVRPSNHSDRHARIHASQMSNTLPIVLIGAWAHACHEL